MIVTWLQYLTLLDIALIDANDGKIQKQKIRLFFALSFTSPAQRDIIATIDLV